MEETSKRIKITQDNSKTVIFIKPHNSLFHAFILELILFAAFMALVFALAPLVTVFKANFIGTIIAYVLAAAAIILKVAAVSIALRSVLWTVGGGETVEINENEFIYSKKIFGLGKRIIIKKEDIKGISLIDYIREKDLVHMIETELSTHGRSFELKTAAKTLKFGVYVSMDDSDVIEKVFVGNAYMRSAAGS
jgi:hypothetical protein